MPVLKRALAVAALLVVFVTTAAPVPTLADGELRVQISNLDTTDYPNIRLTLTVTDQNGLSLTELGNQNVVVTVGSRQIPVSSIRTIDDGGVRISALLAIDTSGSMAGSPITAARDAAGTFIAGLRSSDEISVLTFADRVDTVSGFTNDLAVARTAVSRIVAQGNTALYSAVAESARAIAERQAERRVVVMVSDGADFGSVSQVSRADSLQAARQSGIPFYVVGFGAQIDRAYLQELADVSGGRLFIAPTSAQLQRTFLEVAQQVKTQYVVNLNARAIPLEGDITARLTIQAKSQSGSTEFSFTVPFVIPSQVEPPAPVPQDNSLSGWLPVLALIAVGLAFGYWLWRIVSRRLAARHFRDVPPPLFRPAPTRAASGPPDTGQPLARLEGVDGPTVEVGRDVVSIGVDSGSTYRLPVSASDFGDGSVRIWLANDRFIVHDTSVRSRLRVNEKAMRWGVLTPGDMVDICGVKFVFRTPAGAEASLATRT